MKWRAWVLGVLAAGLLGAAAGALRNHWPLATARRAPVPLAPVALRSPSPAPRGYNLLVMATDAMGSRGRESLNGNTDTMLLIRVEPASDQLSILALPRDTRVPIPGHGVFKLNAANAYGGPDLARRTLEQFLGLPVNRYLVVSLRGVREVVDALHGVRVTIPKRVHYVDHAGHLYIDFQPGLQHLDGAQAESYLRFRHDGEGDLGRVQRLQAFLLEVARQALTPTSPWQAWQLWSAMRPHALTDLRPTEIGELAHLARHLVPGRGLTMTYLPGHSDESEGPWYWIADLRAIAPFLQHTFGAEIPVRREAPPRVALEDHSGAPAGEVRPLVHSLEAAGYRVTEWDRGRPRELSRVISSRGDRSGATSLRNLLGHGEVVVAAIGKLNSDFTIELGRDWRPPGNVMPER